MTSTAYEDTHELLRRDLFGAHGSTMTNCTSEVKTLAGLCNLGM